MEAQYEDINCSADGVRVCWCKKRGFASRQSPLMFPRNGLSDLAVTFFKALNTTCGINKFLLAGEKRMAGGADLSVDLLLGGPGLERVAAEALDGYIGIHGVNTFFHLFLLQYYFTA
jgi:hypothetical protein